MTEPTQQWRERADRLLAESTLVDLLGRHGEVSIKTARSEGTVSATGVDIYEAVINDGVRNVDQLDRLLAAKEYPGDAAHDEAGDDP